MSTTTQRIIFLGVVFVVVLIVVFAIVFGIKKPKSTKKIDLEFWSVYDNGNYFTDIIKEYQRLYPLVTITYVKKAFEDYEKDLISAFAAGKGPDIWSINNTWLPKHKDKIVPLSPTMMTIQNFKDSFVDVAFRDLVVGDQIYGLPLFVDTLALYWNKDIFQSSGIAEPPLTWDDFVKDVKILTKKDDFGNIVRAGAAIGMAKNINRSTDILGLLMMQTGTQMTDPQSNRVIFDKFVSLDGQPFAAGEEALRFYTDFANPQKEVYTWNSEMDYSIDAFYQGKTAMMINYSHHIDTIKNKAPYLNFGVAAIPQIVGSANSISYAGYWAPTVFINSKNPGWAWHFIQFMALKNNALKYLEASKRPTARRDLVDSQKDKAHLGVFALQSLTAKSWYQIDNVAIEKIFADMIESIVFGQSTIRQTIEKSANQINVLYRK